MAKEEKLIRNSSGTVSQPHNRRSPQIRRLTLQPQHAQHPGHSPRETSTQISIFLKQLANCIT